MVHESAYLCIYPISFNQTHSERICRYSIYTACINGIVLAVMQDAIIFLGLTFFQSSYTSAQQAHVKQDYYTITHSLALLSLSQLKYIQFCKFQTLLFHLAAADLQCAC